jgi:mRNA interferase MazF
MLACEIWLADLDPTEGFEQAGKRPVLIISGNAMNSRSGLVIICPLTSTIKNYAGNIVIMPDDANGLVSSSEILIFQVRTISSSRLMKKIGRVPKEVHTNVLKNFIKICTY